MKLFLPKPALLLFLLGTASIALSAAEPATNTPSQKTSIKGGKHNYPAMGKIERLDPELDQLIAPTATIEKLAEGFDWSEGPVWMKKGDTLLLSDVPRNVVFRWKEGTKTSEFLFPSGYTGKTARGGEPGSNGLAVDKNGFLILCQHGDRRIARLEKNGSFTTIAQYYNFRRFNSPNDLAIKSNGDIYFTDPSYGLEKGNQDEKKELRWNGVYKVSTDGMVSLLIDDLTFPNGIAFSPDEKKLYVAVSDPERPVIMVYNLKPDGTTEGGRLFFDATALREGRKGSCDGLKVDAKGNLFASGPGGILVLSPEGKQLGVINTGEATANCAWGDNGSTLYICADMFLCRIKTLTRGAGF
jgi:gluconolactonase